ncbi:MAG: HypC/HybG/HupF family hydrogenase formation chaperone, partial [Acidimicrobiaceae bacterium]|nr:HypC/HybG/HupF family hydrogenase formation chaperone [Acidimicrobiaceae bacterium]
TVWLDDLDPPTAARSGRMVLLYHVLWELTHVVFEHPGLLAEPDSSADEVCITCRDQAEVAEIQAIRDGQLEVMIGGRSEAVEGSLVEHVEVGDLVMVQAGVALSPLPVEAR